MIKMCDVVLFPKKYRCAESNIVLSNSILNDYTVRMKMKTHQFRQVHRVSVHVYQHIQQIDRNERQSFLPKIWDWAIAYQNIV